MRRNPLTTLTTVLAAVLLIALMTAAKAPGQEARSEETERGLDRLARMLTTIKDNYLEEVDPGDLVESAIRGMLYALDPHSFYFNPGQARQMRLEQEGEYYGVGMTVGQRAGEMMVISPMEDGPSARLGIRTGDIITGIDGEPTHGVDLDINAGKLRGPEGTKVTVTITREGLAESFDVVITREKISLKSVPYRFVIADGIGYIRLTHFARSTSEEVAQALRDLKAQGITGLVFDLRANPGGDLDQAVKTADLFLDDDLIVYTKGSREDSRIDFQASVGTTEWSGPMVVLINRGSASGSEVVAGALQDQDRALLAGENSWGKGLVQAVLPLEYGAALGLTTARYYTPSGRLIQRPYVPGRFDEYFDPSHEASPDTMQQTRTSLGRIVYGGNGLAPDVAIADTELTPLSQQVYLRGYIFDFITHYRNTHDGIDASFRADGEVLEEFRAFLREKEFEIDDAQWRQDREFLATRITLEMVTRLAGAAEGYKAVLPMDRQVQKALELMGQAEDLLERKLQIVG